MKVTNFQIHSANQAIGPVLKEPWPVRKAWELVKLGRLLKERAAPIEQVRTNLINQYGETDQRGRSTISEQSPRWAEFVPAYGELMVLEEEIDCEVVRLPLHVEGVKIAPAALMDLEPFVEPENSRA